MTGKPNRTRINSKSLRLHLTFLKLTYRMAEDICGMANNRFTDCMKKNATHHFNDDELIRISTKFDIDIKDFVMADADKMNALKRTIDLEHHFKKEKIRDCRDMKSPIEIVKAVKRKGSVFDKWVSLPKKEIDPRKHFTDGMMDYRVEDGRIILYNTGNMSKADMEVKYNEAVQWRKEKE